jgi:hypothetical protein
MVKGLRLDSKKAMPRFNPGMAFASGLLIVIVFLSL